MLAPSHLPSPEYLDRKFSELKCLYAYLQAPAETLKRPIHFSEVIDLKFHLRDSIKKHLPLNPYESITNLTNGKRVNRHGLRFEYSYQRSALKMVDANPLGQIYPLLRFDSSQRPLSQGQFTRCGQAATYTILNALRLLLGESTIETLSENLYFETQYLFKIFPFHRERASQRPSILYLDSSTEKKRFRPEPLFAKRRYECLVIDTTCFPSHSPHLKNLIRLSLVHQIPCILTRSHMKLDSLGLEYGLLGSLVILHGKDFPKEKKIFCQKLRKVCMELSQIQGGSATLDQIYPFWNDSLFHRLNKKRIELCQKNNLRLYRKLRRSLAAASPVCKLHFFQHQLFLWMEFEKKVSQKALQNLGRILTFSGVPYKFAESFGFDFMTISIFPNQYRQMVLRVSLPDFDENLVDLCARILETWSQHAFKEEMK